jgi:hypothetical protein
VIAKNPQGSKRETTYLHDGRLDRDGDLLADLEAGEVPGALSESGLAGRGVPLDGDDEEVDAVADKLLSRRDRVVSGVDLRKAKKEACKS